MHLAQSQVALAAQPLLLAVACLEAARLHQARPVLVDLARMHQLRLHPASALPILRADCLETKLALALVPLPHPILLATLRLALPSAARRQVLSVPQPPQLWEGTLESAKALAVSHFNPLSRRSRIALRISRIHSRV